MLGHQVTIISRQLEKENLRKSPQLSSFHSIRFPAVNRICEDIPDGGHIMPDGGAKLTDGALALPDGGSERIEFLEDLHLSFQFSVGVYPGGGRFHAGRGALHPGRGNFHPGRDSC